MSLGGFGVRHLFLVLLVISATVVQVTVLPRINPLWVNPDLVLGIVLVLASLYGVAYGLGAAALGGVLLDVLTLTPLGLHSLALLAAALTGGLARRRLFRTDLLVPMGLVVVATITSQALLAVARWLAHMSASPRLMVEVAVLTALLNVAAVPVIYVVILLLDRVGLHDAGPSTT